MMLARFDRDVASKKPAWVVVKAGINDITWQRMNKGNDLPMFEANVNAICDKAEKAGIRVMLVKSTLVGERNYRNDANNRKLAEYVAAVERVAKARGCLLADAYAAECKALDELKQQWMPYFTTDNLHLNGRGNILVACEILRAFGVDGACVDACRKAWEKLPSMTTSAKFVAGLKNRLPPCEYAALGRLAAEKGETVEFSCPADGTWHSMEAMMDLDFDLGVTELVCMIVKSSAAVDEVCLKDISLVKECEMAGRR